MKTMVFRPRPSFLCAEQLRLCKLLVIAENFPIKRTAPKGLRNFSANTQAFQIPSFQMTMDVACSQALKSSCLFQDS